MPQSARGKPGDAATGISWMRRASCHVLFFILNREDFSFVNINGVEEEGRLIYEPWRVSTKNGLDSALVQR